MYAYSRSLSTLAISSVQLAVAHITPRYRTAYKSGAVLSYHVGYFSTRCICHSERYERFISRLISPGFQAGCACNRLHTALADYSCRAVKVLARTALAGCSFAQHVVFCACPQTHFDRRISLIFSEFRREATKFLTENPIQFR